MPDITLPQFDEKYDQHKMGVMVDTLENKFSNISTVIAFTQKGSYQLNANTTPVANSIGTLTDLISYTIQANTIAKDGYNIDIMAWGSVAANANNKRIKLLFGSTTIYDTGTVAANSGTWCLRGTVVRTGSATQQAIVTMVSGNSLLAYNATYSVPTETLSANIVLKCTGQGIATNDIIQDGLLVRIFPQQ